MREIKFRGKRGDSGEWVYGNLAIDFDGNCIIFTGDIADYYAQTLYEVIPESVGQYTGLKDKDGKEIYEGDIVEWECEYDSEDNDQSVIYERKAVELVEGVYEPVFAFHIDDMPKVIGNTTDNPEMVEAI